MNSFVDHSSHAPHSVPAIQAFPGRLHVVTALFNPLRYRARYRNYRAFEKHVADAGAILTTVECAFGGRPFEITDPLNPRHVQVRTSDELWLKENLLNIGISRLPADARYIAALDADMAFHRPDWAQETLQMLQHHPMVQLYSEITYLGPDHEPINRMESFVERWINGQPLRVGKGLMRKEVFYSRRGRGKNPAECAYNSVALEAIRKNAWGQPGGGWAYRREALDAVGGLLDFAVLGSADSLMMFGVLGVVEEAIEQDDFSPGYRSEILDWQRRAQTAFRQNVGVVRGGAVHYWHGNMIDRRYGLRNRILHQTQFDPRRDVKRDTQGVWRLHDDGTPRFVQLRDDIRSYFSGRNEDSIDDSMYRH